MIRKTGLAIIAVMAASVYEAILLGFLYLLFFGIALMMAFWVDIVLFHASQSKKMKAVTIRRDLKDNYGRKNQWVTINLSVENSSKSRVAFHYFDSLSDVFRSRGDFKGYLTLMPGESRIISYEIAPQAVGKYYVGPVEMYAEDPFRICVLNYVAERITEIHVSPSLADLHGARADRMSNIRFTEGLHRSKSVGQGYNFYGIRPYTESDDLRYVSWSRYGTVNGEDLYVKQMEEERQMEVHFLIDYSLAVNYGYSDKRMYDRLIIDSINAAYSIIKNHDGVGFMLFSSDHDIYIKPARSDVSINTLERAVADIRPSGEFDLAAALENVRQKIRKSSLIMVMTPLSGSTHFSLSKSSLIQKGKQITVFIVEPSEFIDQSGLTEPYKKILRSQLMRRINTLKNDASMIRALGLNCYVVQESRLYARMVMEYQYGKIVG
ncbi:MAG: DUF58 domain-containing protein [Candidatus Thermoplasmatota archaeon]|nr:DUF58 domain-containing protein [Candidatus Thermoplasmatota archaeon]MCL5730799.1 DUF58 domain-containing protein [Candidatus Thermoplasmatota archaeon]